ncbi:MAG: radical SAM protein [Euryarchaeota archaeon]|nr:radical SAM protein [Euryarchaeota archaeon]
MKVYLPGRHFPSISVTGTGCALDCAHCGAAYLRHMLPAPEPGGFHDFLASLKRKGAGGFLLSGGCDDEGRVPLGPYLPGVRKAKDTLGLRANVHVGLLDEGMMPALVSAGPDAISVDIIGDEKVISDVYGLDADPADYARAIETLLGDGLRVVPHITIGLNASRPSGEEEAIGLLEGLGVPALIFNVLVPTKGTRFEGAPAVGNGRVLEMMSLARRRLPGTEIMLGCMRPKGNVGLEVEALRGAVDGIVNPSRAALQRCGARHETVEACCAIPSRSA